MENWIGVGIWVVMGVAIGLAVKSLMPRAEEQPGHGAIIAVLGAFGALIGGMLGVGILHLYEPLALSVGGMAGAALLSVAVTVIYRWGVRGMT